MKKVFLKLLSVMLSLICVFSSFSISAFAYDYDDDEIVDEDAVLALCHNTTPSTYSLPYKPNEYERTGWVCLKLVVWAHVLLRNMGIYEGSRGRDSSAVLVYGAFLWTFKKSLSCEKALFVILPNCKI